MVTSQNPKNISYLPSTPSLTKDSGHEETSNHSISAGLYVATAILQQGLDFLKNSVTDENQLVYQSKLLPGSTIGARWLPFNSHRLTESQGKHLRHARDHFNLLAQVRGILAIVPSVLKLKLPRIQCLSKPPPFVLSYDIRTRDTPMERSLSAAISCLQTSIDDLNSILGDDVSDGSIEHGGRDTKLANDTLITLNAVTPFPQTFQTSLGREVSLINTDFMHISNTLS